MRVRYFTFQSNGKQLLVQDAGTRLRLDFMKTRELCAGFGQKGAVLNSDSVAAAIQEVFDRSPGRYGRFAAWMEEEHPWRDCNAISKETMRSLEERILLEGLVYCELGYVDEDQDWEDYLLEQMLLRGCIGQVGRLADRQRRAIRANLRRTLLREQGIEWFYRGSAE
jgi:hypothetical protein